MEIQSEDSYVGIYHHAVKAGLFNNSQLINKFEKVENMVPLVRVNNFFFGSNFFASGFNYLNLAKENIVRKEYGIYYLSIKKLENYLEYAAEHIELDTSFNCCPYNYYKFMQNLGKNFSIPSHYQLMIKTIDNFLNYLDTIDTTQSRTIRYILTPGAKSGELKGFECEVSDVLVLPGHFANEFVIKLLKPGSPIFLRVSTQINELSESNILFLQTKPNYENYEQVYNYINNQILMDTPEEFLICNIERVCGSRIFAEIMVKSYLNKSKFIFSFDSISSTILWKNTKTESDFAKYFIQKYPMCVGFDGSVVMINFEGINKFFLNISEDDVANFDVKEQINEMYYNSMHELIHSFEQLYKNKK